MDNRYENHAGPSNDILRAPAVGAGTSRTTLGALTPTAGALSQLLIRLTAIEQRAAGQANEVIDAGARVMGPFCEEMASPKRDHDGSLLAQLFGMCDLIDDAQGLTARGIKRLYEL